MSQQSEAVLPQALDEAQISRAKKALENYYKPHVLDTDKEKWEESVEFQQRSVPHIKYAVELAQDIVEGMEEDPILWGFDQRNLNYKFFTLYRSEVAKLSIFSAGNEDRMRVGADVISLVTYIYCYYYECAARHDPVSPCGDKVIAFFSKFSSDLPSHVITNLEIIKSKVIIALSVDSQLDVRGEIKKLSALCLEELRPMSQKLDGWASELSEWDKKTQALKSYIEKMHAQLNFVGLAMAFTHLIGAKEDELKTQWRAMSAFAILIVLVAAGTFSLRILDDTTGGGLAVARHAAPIIGIELLLLYFFRIALKNYYSVKAQLLQLKLRSSLCAFIEEYMAFKARIPNEKDIISVEKFEAIIFSGITADIDKIPSQFDGIEQLATPSRKPSR